jgi:hypothetical protein
MRYDGTMRFISAIASCVLFVGCTDATKDFEKLADRACECAADDASCGNKVLSDVAKFAETHKTSDGDANRINEAGKRIYDCLGTAGILPNALTAALEKMVD